MINGAHIVIYSTDAERDRALLRDVLGFPHVDAGHGWLIFGLPPAEAAIHPSDENDRHQLYLMCDDVDGEAARLRRLGVACSEIRTVGWGRVTEMRLPGGGSMGLYEPRHPRPAGS
jgi:catechol 2,3-dioxygenase-like lactoylglutathione lyase family enzyme